MSFSANSFDAVRFLAAILVVYGHAYPLTAGGSPMFGGNSVQAIGVKIFFVISGYLIMGSWQRDPNILRFAKRRLMRILPGLAVVVMLSVLVLGSAVTSLPLGEYFENSRTWHYFSNIAMRPQYDLPGVFAGLPYPNAVNGSLWSLPAEVAMYVIGPLVWWIGIAVMNSARAGITVASIVLVSTSLYIVRFSSQSAPWVIYGSSINSFLDVAPYFLLGAFCRLWKIDRHVNLHLAGVAWIIFSLIQLSSLITELALYLLLPYTVLAFGLKDSRVGRYLSMRGDISYGVYLYGFPLQQLAALMFENARRNAWANFGITLVPLLLIAFISWRFIERPVLRWKPVKINELGKLSTKES